MAVPGSGLGSQLVIAKETTYGTRVAPTKAFEYEGEGLQLKRNRLVSKGLRAGRLYPNATRVHTTTRQVDGGLDAFEVPNQGLGTILDLLHGLVPTVVQQASSAAWLQTHLIGTSDPNKSATVQIGTPDTGSTVRVYEYEGCMVTDFKFSCDTGGFLMLELTLDGEDRTTSQTLATATYPANLRTFHFGQCTPTVNGTAVTDVFDSVTISGSLSRKVDRFKLGGSGVKAKPILNDYYSTQIAFGGDFKDNTFTSLYDADTLVPIIVSFVGPIIGGTYTEFIRFTTGTGALIDSGDPEVKGPDVVQQGLTFDVYDDGTNAPLKIEYQSLDTAI